MKTDLGLQVSSLQHLSKCWMIEPDQLQEVIRNASDGNASNVTIRRSIRCGYDDEMFVFPYVLFTKTNTGFQITDYKYETGKPYPPVCYEIDEAGYIQEAKSSQPGVSSDPAPA